MTDTAVQRLDISAPPGAQEFTVSRIIDAPRDRVFKAHIDPQLIPKWWGPSRYETIVDNMEPRSGGSWRYLNRAGDGTEFGFHGVFHEIVPPERITWTFEFEGMPGHVSLETVTFEDLGGRTRITAHSIYQSAQDRDAAVGSGMTEGIAETWDRLEALARELA